MTEETSKSAGRVVVADLGKKKRKLVKRLRRGEGKLMDDVRQMVTELQAEGEAATGDTIVVIIEKKPRSPGSPFRR